MCAYCVCMGLHVVVVVEKTHGAWWLLMRTFPPSSYTSSSHPSSTCHVQYTEEEYMERLDLVAAALRAWDKVQVVKDDVMARKERPRVGKAVSIMLDLNETQWKEWFVL